MGQPRSGEGCLSDCLLPLLYRETSGFQNCSFLLETLAVRHMIHTKANRTSDRRPPKRPFLGKSLGSWTLCAFLVRSPCVFLGRHYPGPSLPLLGMGT